MYEIHLQNIIILKLLISKNFCIQFKKRFTKHAKKSYEIETDSGNKVACADKMTT